MSEAVGCPLPLNDPLFQHYHDTEWGVPVHDDQKQFEKAMKKFMKKSKHANTHYVGKPPKATRDVVDDSFTYALIVSFKSAKEQEKYQKEKAHLQFIEEAQSLWNKVIVYDSQGVKL